MAFASKICLSSKPPRNVIYINRRNYVFWTIQIGNWGGIRWSEIFAGRHFVDDMPVVTVVKQKKKEEQDKAKGLAMRKVAMETYTSKCACKNELFYRRFVS